MRFNLVLFKEKSPRISASIRVIKAGGGQKSAQLAKSARNKKARNSAKPREKQVKRLKVSKANRKQQKITSCKGYVIKVLRKE